MNKKYIFILLISTTLLLISSCARTVTSKVLVGNDIIVELWTRGNPDSTKYKYYFIFSPLRAPLLPSSIGSYFVGPGEIYDQRKINVGTGTDVDIDYYYKNYFYSWSDFVLYNINNFYLTSSINQGGFFDANTTTQNHYNNLPDASFSYTSSIVGNKIQITFPLRMLSSSRITNLYFRFVTVDDTQYMVDYSASTQYIVNEINNYLSGNENSDNNINSALDIINWKVTIQ